MIRRRIASQLVKALRDGILIRPLRSDTLQIRLLFVRLERRSLHCIAPHPPIGNPMTSMTNFTPTSFTKNSAVNFTVNGTGIPASPGVVMQETMVSGITWSVNASTILTSQNGSKLTFTATSSGVGSGTVSGSIQLSLMIITPCQPLQEAVTYN
jgi:hypothetical protein